MHLPHLRVRTASVLQSFCSLRVPAFPSQFVAHPNIQQLLAALWYEGVPGFRRKTILEKCLEILKVSLCGAKDMAKNYVVFMSAIKGIFVAAAGLVTLSGMCVAGGCAVPILLHVVYVHAGQPHRPPHAHPLHEVPHPLRIVSFLLA